MPKLKKVYEDDLLRAMPKNSSKTLSMSLPLPPSVNSMHVNTMNGGRRLTSKAMNYIRDSRALINLFVEEQSWTKPHRETWLYIDLVFYMPDRRIRDSHNMLKLLLDVMQDVVYENDYFVLPRIQSVEYDTKHPRVDLVILPQTKNNRLKGLKITEQ